MAKNKKPTTVEIAAQGGNARAEALTAEQRSEIAKRAAAVRWGEKRLRATHRGNFQEEFGLDIDCYVLDDEQKTAVISQRGMGAALGFGKVGGRLPKFVRGERIARHLDPELAQKFANPLIFQWAPPIPKRGESLEANLGPVVVYGYDVTMLIDLCKAVIAADDGGWLLQRQKTMAKQARIIVNASAKAGIKNLVYALAGYDATKDEVIQAFKFYVREEAREYEREFPEQLYNEWYRLYELPKPERNRPWKFKHLTVEQVYNPLARSNGKILALTREQKAAGEDRHAKLHQFLSEIGVKALRTHLGQLLGIAQVSETRAEYEKRVGRIFGAQQMLDFYGPRKASAPSR